MDNLPRPGPFDPAAQAYRTAGLGPEDVGAAEVRGSFPVTAPVGPEPRGLRGPGEGPELVADGRPRPGGVLPATTNGGGPPSCRQGRYGLLSLVEAVRRVRGERGDRQVADPSAVLAHGTGGIFPTRATVLSGRDG